MSGVHSSIYSFVQIMKNISTSLLVLFLSLLLVSCGGSDDKKSAASSVSDKDKEGPASAPTATASDGPVGGASYNLSVVCSEAGEIVSIIGSGLNSGTQTHTCADSGAEEFSLSLEQEVSHPSPNELTISSTDQYENPAGGETTVNVPIDTLAPSISIRNEGNIIEGSVANFEIAITDDHITNLSYVFSVNQGSVTSTTCTLNPCEVSVSTVKEGPLTLTVAASAVTDDAGNSNATDVTSNLAVGATTLSLGSVPTGTNLNAATYTVSGTCVADQGNVTVTVGGTVTDDISCTGTPGSYTVSLDITGITTNTMTVEALQNGNRVSETSVNDRVGPSSVPTATAPTGPVGGASYNLSVVCNEAEEIVSIRGNGLNPDTQTHTCAGSGAEDFPLSLEQEVSHPSPNELTISSTDQYKNPASGTTTVNVPIDTLAPSISIRNDGDIIEGSVANFEITVTDDHITNLSYVFSVNQGSATVTPSICTSNPCRVTVSGALTGPLTLTVAVGAVTDDAGNSNAMEVEDSLNVVASTLSVSDAPTGTSINATSYPVSGNCNMGEGDVTVIVGTPDVVKEVSCDGNPGTYEATLDISSVNANPMIVKAVQDGLTENFLPGPVNDRVGPASAPMATAPTDLLVEGASYNLSIVCNEAGEIVSIRGNGLDPATQTHTCAGSGAEDFPLSLEQEVSHPSPNNLTISSTDQYKNPAGGETTVNVPIDTLAPSVSIGSHISNIDSSNAHDFTVEGTCTKEGQAVMVSVGGISPSMNPDCTSGSWSVGFDVTALNGASISITADHSSSGGGSAPQASTTVTNDFICPTNFVAVPALTGYTVNSFCVMKYEAKKDGSDNAISQASGRPYVDINRTDSITACQNMGSGYDLMTNDEWQTLARNIELVPSNWSTNNVGTGSLNQGHSSDDTLFFGDLAASSDDNKACEGTGQTCDSKTWNSQRRTHTLSNGEVIWDVSGNVQERVKDDNRVSYGSNAYFSQITTTSHSTSGSLSGGTTTTSRVAKNQFGPSGNYSSLNSGTHGGLGYGQLDTNSGAIVRGNKRGAGVDAGIFAVNLGFSAMFKSIGFRCVFRE